MKNNLTISNISIVIGVIIALAVMAALLALVNMEVTGNKGNLLSDEFKYDIENLTVIDPNLILYQQKGSAIETGFAAAKGIALDARGLIYVIGDQAARIFNPTGRMLQEIPLAAEPTAVTIAEDGRIYICLGNHIEVYDAQAGKLATWPVLSESSIFTSIAVYRNNVFVADAGRRVIVRYDTQGSIINYIGKKDPAKNIAGFVIPSPYFDLAAAPDGLLRVANPGRHRIEAYTFQGDLEFYWGKASPDIEGFCGCCNPVNFAILPDESFVTSEKGLTRIKIYNARGDFTGVVAGPDQLGKSCTAVICQFPAECQAGAFDLAVDKQGTIFVLDTLENVVRIFRKKSSI
ncbi:MAG: hypothetical protein ABIG61_01830 [Planctomycetota bacterium]